MSGYVALGKYSDAVEDALHLLCQNDWAQDQGGDNSEWVTYGWKLSISDEDAEAAMGLEVMAELAEHVTARELRGDWIISEDSQGFVHARKCESETQQREIWERLIDDYGHFQQWDELEYDSEVTLIDDHKADDGTPIPAGSMGRVGEGQHGNQYAVLFEDFTDSEGVTVTLWLRYDEVVD